MKFFHWLYANLNGYFWLDCPVCGEKFGGHQTKLHGFKKIQGKNDRCICDKCTKKGLSDRRFYA